MKLTRLSIDLNSYGDYKGQYTGLAVFDGGDFKTEISLTPDRANQVLQVCASGIIEAAEHTAKLASANIVASVALLENKVEEGA